MKLKYYLRGIGIGLIVTTLVMMIAFMLHKDELLSDDEIIERAAALGMVMPEETVTRDTLSDNSGSQPETLDASESEAEDGETDDAVSDDKASDNKAVDDEAGASEEDAQTQEDDSDAASGKKNKSDETEQTVDEQVELSIVGGEYSDIVSQKLYKAGVIEDAEDFNKYLADGGYDNLIQPGTYTISVGADYDTIISIITEQED